MDVESVIRKIVPGHVTPVSLDLRPGLTFNEWMTVGEKIYRVRQACHFWLGDWLNYGERAYGEMYAQAMDDTKYAYYTLVHDKSVAARIEPCRRRQNLSWSHHEAVAFLEPTEQDKWLDRAEKNEWTREEFREKLREAKTEVSPKMSSQAGASVTQDNIELLDIQVVNDDGKIGKGVRHMVLVECASIEEQRRLIARFTNEGLRCKAINE